MVSRIVKLNFWCETHSKSTGLLAESETGLLTKFRLSEFALAELRYANSQWKVQGRRFLDKELCRKVTAFFCLL